jgi:hypothetical protein
MKASLVTWLLRLVVVVILLQTLCFKFSGAAESIYIFSTLGIEPYGRFGSSVAELIASILILLPRTTVVGVLIGWGVMIGAILSDLFILGIEVQGDGGALFILALITFICCSIVVYQNKSKIPNLFKFKL